MKFGYFDDNAKECNEAPACLFFQRGGGGPPGLPVFPWQYREQRRHVPDDRPHAPVLLSGYV